MSKFIKSTYLNKKETDNGKEKVIMVVKDKDGNKKFKEVSDPMMHYYVTKDEYWLPDGVLMGSMPKDQVRTVYCKHKDIIKSIVDEAGSAGEKAEYKRIMKSGNYQEFRKLKDFHLINNVHGSDINIEDYHINEFIKKSKDNAEIPLDICFFDIEVDGSEVIGFPDPIESKAPINIITVTDWSKKKTLSFCLKYDTENYRETMNDKKTLFDKLDSIYNDENGELGMNLGMEFSIFEFDTEIEVINAFLKYINEVSRPDICTA